MLTLWLLALVGRFGCFVLVGSFDCFAYVVLCRWNVDTCSQNSRRVMKAQHGRQIPPKPYFTWYAYYLGDVQDKRLFGDVRELRVRDACSVCIFSVWMYCSCYFSQYAE